MNSTSGSWPLNHALRLFPRSAPSAGVEIARLVLLGVVGVAVHAAARGRFELGPGHQGFAWIALLMFGRLTSGSRWAGTTAALGAAGASFLPLWKLGDPAVWVGYMAAGATVDLFYGALSAWRGQLWILAILGGVAHVAKPLARFLITGFTGWRYESLIAGLPYPVASHFVFGAMGALLAAGLMRARRRRLRPTSGRQDERAGLIK